MDFLCGLIFVSSGEVEDVVDDVRGRGRTVPLNPEPETQNPKPETRNPKPETRSPKTETRNPKPETRDHYESTPSDSNMPYSVALREVRGLIY